MKDRPIPPLALRRSEAAIAVGVSDESFDQHVRPHVPAVTLGSVRVYPIAGLEQWLHDNAIAPTDELNRRRAA